MSDLSPTRSSEPKVVQLQMEVAFLRKLMADLDSVYSRHQGMTPGDANILREAVRRFLPLWDAAFDASSPVPETET